MTFLSCAFIDVVLLMMRERNLSNGIVPSLRMDIFQKVEIRLPLIPKQQHICKIIDAFYTKLEVEQRGISILQELKQFLLSQMFI